MRTMRDPKRKPTHPGEVLREDVLPALKMTQTEFAKELLLEKRAMSADMALRVAKLTRTTPESWLRMQEALDLWELERDEKRYRDIAPIAA
jgi:antitoxin HigA-1